MYPVIVIAGPTASGKSDVSIEAARRLDGEVIVADSMQVYRGMDIGTAKVAPSERHVAHHCIDLIDPGEPFSSALYQEAARGSIDDVRARGKAAILSGGTGFYIRSVIDDYRFPAGEQVGNPLRDELAAFAEERGARALWERLHDVDPESAADVHPNNVKRVMRALELHAEGESYHGQLQALKEIPQLYDARMYCIDVERDELIARIDERVDRMRELGLVDEVQRLLNLGFRDAVTASAAIGYKEIVSALDGERTLDQAFEDVKTATRRYAKRQRSWFNADPRYIHLDGNGRDAVQVADELVAGL